MQPKLIQIAVCPPTDRNGYPILFGLTETGRLFVAEATIDNHASAISYMTWHELPTPEVSELAP